MPVQNESKVVPMLVGILIGIAIGAGGVWWYQQKQPKTTSTTTTSTTTTSTDPTAGWKTYTNSTYGYSFKYDNAKLEISSENNTPEKISVGSIADTGAWHYDVELVPNGDAKTLEQVAEQARDSRLGTSSIVSNSNGEITDTSVGGLVAKQITISNFEAYGNTQVVTLTNRNILTITGDASGNTRATEFARFVGTFVFIK